jgi:hypothetical protein
MFGNGPPLPLFRESYRRDVGNVENQQLSSGAGVSSASKKDRPANDLSLTLVLAVAFQTYEALPCHHGPFGGGRTDVSEVSVSAYVIKVDEYGVPIG